RARHRQTDPRLLVSRGRSRPMSGARIRRAVAFVAVLMVSVLALTAAVPQGGRLPGQRGSVSALWSWLGLPSLSRVALPPTPKQQQGTAAGRPSTVPADATRAKRGNGKPTIGRAPGELAEYVAHGPRV